MYVHTVYESSPSLIQNFYRGFYTSKVHVLYLIQCAKQIIRTSTQTYRCRSLMPGHACIDVPEDPGVRSMLPTPCIVAIGRVHWNHSSWPKCVREVSLYKVLLCMDLINLYTAQYVTCCLHAALTLTTITLTKVHTVRR